MNTRPTRDKVRTLSLDQKRFEAVERLAIYETCNFVLLAHGTLRRAFDLRGEAFEVFFLIAIATAQRHVRSAAAGDAVLDRTPLTPEQSGSISRRRIADTLDIPFETVRRQVAMLKARGLVTERGRGQVSTTGGTLERLGAAGTTLLLARQQVALTNALIRMGVLVDTGAVQTISAPKPAVMDQS